MTVNNFIREKIAERVQAVKTLAEKIDINDIELFEADPVLSVYTGIEKLAELFGSELLTEREPGEKYDCVKTYFWFDDVKIEHKEYEAHVL